MENLKETNKEICPHEDCKSTDVFRSGGATQVQTGGVWHSPKITMQCRKCGRSFVLVKAGS